MATAIETKRRRRKHVLRVAACCGVAMGALVAKEYRAYYHEDQEIGDVATNNIGWLTRLWVGWIVDRQIQEAERGGNAALVEMLRSSISTSLERPALGSEDAAVAGGRRLPREYYFEDPEAPNAPTFRLGAIVEGKVIVRNGREYAYARLLASLGPRLWSQRSPEYVEWLAERADVLPPRRIDVLIDWCRWSQRLPGQGFSEQVSEALRKMADGRNPVYRDDAVLLASRWATSWEEEKAVYLRALDEEDPVLRSVGVYMAQQRSRGDAEILDAVKRVHQQSAAR